MNKIIIPRAPFYFIRHGETDWNTQHKLMGHQDIPLNQNGIDQTYSAAYILADIEISSIFSSPLKRATQTGDIIAQVCEIDIMYMEQLKERNFGSFEGSPNNKLSLLSDEGMPNDAENFIDFETRVLRGVNEILSSGYYYPLIVSHGGVFKALTYALTKQIDRDCQNCQIFFFCPSITDDGWDITPV